ncbi:MAG TPA: transketolase C-terminal domain-containing protein [Armatimonadota bacterium]|nr:transketolase C-terminal domain-containing protein [Armatimonadota bacterium]
MRRMIEGSRAVAEVVGLCRPGVISAYPITPQTHIVEELSQLVADGDIEAEYVRVESEHSAASVCLGAVAGGVRAYSATTSQGLMLMAEVLYNIAGMRLPLVITGVNRALSAPLSIWNDQQDTLALRDSGWLQLYAEDNQEALDMHVQAYKITEDDRVLLPVLVCMDGFILTHTYETVDMPTQEEVDAFLPLYEPLYELDPKDPYTLGAFAGPEMYEEMRYEIQRDALASKAVVKEVAKDFQAAFGRWMGDVIETYRCEEAETIYVAMGSVIGTLKDWADLRREQGEKIGVLKVRCYRPFPQEELREALGGAKRVVVLEKAVSVGGYGILPAEIRAALYGQPKTPPVHAAVTGLGGRDITFETFDEMQERAQAGEMDFFAGLRTELLEAS